MLERLRREAVRALSTRSAPLFVLGLGLLLLSPSIGSGLAADDWFHRLVLTGSGALPSVHHRPMDLFVFSNGDPALGHAQQEDGMIAWWADPTTKIAFFRPLSAATHWLDYRLFPDAPWAMHVHSLLWFAAALWAVLSLYRRFFAEPWLAVLAFGLYAVDDAHGFVVSWVANRNALIALALGVPVLLLHDRSRRDTAPWAAWAAPLAFTVTLLAGESAVAAGGYLVAYAVFMDGASSRRRLVSLVPYAVVFVLWRALYAGLGYGTHGSGLAVDPAHDPVGFARAVVVRLPVLLLAQVAAPPSDVWELFPALSPLWQPAVYVLALVALGFFGWVFQKGLAARKVTAFWIAGTVLSVLPACSQVASDRLLLFAGIGAQALVASVLGAALGGGSAGRGLFLRLGTAALFVFHVVIAPLWLPFRARGAADVRHLIQRGERTVPFTPDIAGKTVVLVNPPADAFAGYLPMYRAAEGIPRPAHLRWLVTGATAATVRRIDERTLEIDTEDGLMSLASERMQRSAEHPLRVGETVRLTGLTVTVESRTADARPKVVRAVFDTALEDPGLVFLAWSEKDLGFRPFVPPAVGGKTELPRLDFAKLRI